jgi:hypothetical protein
LSDCGYLSRFYPESMTNILTLSVVLVDIVDDILTVLTDR